MRNVKGLLIPYCVAGWIFIVTSTSFAQGQELVPFKLEVIEKPKQITNGQNYKLSFEIKNTLTEEITICLLPGFHSYSWQWQSRNGVVEGGGLGGGVAKLIVATVYDPVTQSFQCRYFHYERGDFITLSPLGSKIVETNIKAPEDCRAKVATLTLNFESQYDGSELNLKAWTGKARPIQITFPIRKTQANRTKN